MKVTSQEEYGLRCIVQIALLTQESELASLENIAQNENLSSDYVAKLLMTLRKSELVESVRGKTGGYRLTKPPSEITLYEIIKSLSGELFESESCEQFTGKTEECIHVSACSIRTIWMSMSHIVANIMKQITLLNLLENEDILTKYIKKEIVLSI